MSAELGTQATPESPQAPAPDNTPTPATPESPQAPAPAGEPARAQLGNAPAPAPAGPWHDTLPNDLRDNPLFQRYTSMEDAMRGFAHAQQFIGQKEIVNGLVKPGDDANDADRAAYQKQLNEMIGVPENATAYTLQGAAVPGELQPFAELAHGLNMSNEQFEGLAQGLAKFDADADAAREKKYAQLDEQNLTAIKGEWGTSYDQNMATANKALEALGDADLDSFLTDTGGLTDPGVLRFFHKLGTQLEGGTLKLGGAGGAGGTPPMSDWDRLQAIGKKPEMFKPHLDGGAVQREYAELEAKLRAQSAG